MSHVPLTFQFYNIGVWKMCVLNFILTCVLLAFGSLFPAVNSDRTNLKIYENIQSDIFCFRRLNATHQIGCASKRNGNVGVLYLVENEEGIENITKDAPSMDFVVAMPITLFNMKNMKLLKQMDYIQGVLLFKIKEQKQPQSFSADQSCPNRNFGFYTENLNSEYAACKKQEWNKLRENEALGMMFEDWGIPIFIITNETNIKNITNCYKKHNEPKDGIARQWPLCSVQMLSVMLAARDTATCMRRSRMVSNLNEVKTCDPLSDKNIVNTLFPTNKSEEYENQSVILVGARMDSFSMFDRLAPGAHSAVTGLVTLLAVSKNMALLQDKIREKLGQNPGKNVMFILFNGEAFDYIGSSRIVYDMQKGIFPVSLSHEIKDQPALLKLHHISHFIELSQLAPNNEPASLWMHTDPISIKESDVSKDVKELIKLFQEESKRFKGINVSAAPEEMPLPPASFQSFLRQDNRIPGLVITDHMNEFSNRYYNSLFDTNETLDTVSVSEVLADVSSIVTAVLYQLLTNEKLTDPVKPDEKLIPGLLECYLKNASCSLFRQIADPLMTERLRVEPYPLYVSVDTGGHAKANAITLYTRYLLAYLTGTEEENLVRKNCSGSSQNQIYHYDWMAGSTGSGTCVKSTVMYTIAQSPAFITDDWKSADYSTWTESVWLETSARIFLQPGKTQEAVTLVLGIIIFMISMVSVYFINEHASIIFNTKPLVGC